MKGSRNEVPRQGEPKWGEVRRSEARDERRLGDTSEGSQLKRTQVVACFRSDSP